ncbi:MAG: phosphoenolpyruvate-utilizing N-terminal domain-containing protein, partial [Planctomycetota bacterium]
MIDADEGTDRFMKILRGIAVSPGIVRGRAFVLDDGADRHVARRPISLARLGAEVARFEAACAAASDELRDVHVRALDEFGEDAAKIFLFHIAALADPMIVSPVREPPEDLGDGVLGRDRLGFDHLAH